MKSEYSNWKIWALPRLLGLGALTLGLLTGTSAWAQDVGSDGFATIEDASLLNSPIPPTTPLSEAFRTQVCGDYVAAGVGLRFSASGTINISLPAGATIQNAFLYWSIMQSGTPSAALFNVSFNSNAVVGALVGTAGDPCWTPNRIHNFAADVTVLAVNGANSVTLPSIAGTLREGASLVVIFQDPASNVVREVIIRDGAVSFVLGPAESTTFSGFSATSGVAKTTWIVADGQKNAGLNNRIFDDLGEVANHTLRGDDPGANLYWDTRTDLVSDASDGSVTLAIESASDTGTFDCLTWVAQVLSVDVGLCCIQGAEICDVDDDGVEVLLPPGVDPGDVVGGRITMLDGVPVNIPAVEIDDDCDCDDDNGDDEESPCVELEFDDLPFDLDEAIEICVELDLADGTITCETCFVGADDDDDDSDDDDDDDDSDDDD